jgi:DNA topoisomerase IA
LAQVFQELVNRVGFTHIQAPFLLLETSCFRTNHTAKIGKKQTQAFNMYNNPTHHPKEGFPIRFVLAEKPSVARALAAVLGANEKKDGYLQGNGYLVSWCVGHLVELAGADAYDVRYAKWRREDLSILPAKFRTIVPKDRAKQLQVIAGLMARPEVDTVICATDAGREGELIFRLVYEYCHCGKPIERLWILCVETHNIHYAARQVM